MAEQGFVWSWKLVGYWELGHQLCSSHKVRPLGSEVLLLLGLVERVLEVKLVEGVIC